MTDNSFQTAIELMKKALEEKESSFLKKSEELIINSECIEEIPRWLCELANCYAELNEAKNAQRIVNKTKLILKKIKKESIWKFVNYSCYTAYYLFKFEKINDAKKVLQEVVNSVEEIDIYYEKRKNQIQNYLNFFKNKNNNLIEEPKDYEVEELFGKIFLEKDKEKKMIEFSQNFSLKKTLNFVNTIEEDWRRVISLSICARLVKNSEDSHNLNNIAFQKAIMIQHYWVKEDALEIISKYYITLFLKSENKEFLNCSLEVFKHINDSWKKARCLCYLIKILIIKHEYKLANSYLIQVEQLKEKILYLERKAMSYLLISEVYTKMNMIKLSNKFLFLANKILNRLSKLKRKEVMYEYNNYLSLGGKSEN